MTRTSDISTRQNVRLGTIESPAIVVESLGKSYGALRAVDGLSFSVASGEVFALLGPNGAGKTTTLEILEGYRDPDSGRARILGLDPRKDRRLLALQVGVMLQQDGLQPAMTAREILRLYAGFFPHPLPVEELLDRVGLRAAARTRARRLSGGQKRRLALAVALVGRPRLVFLDEPTTGMDPRARLTTWEIVRGLRDEGVTVVLTTHVMDEAERLADRVAIVDHGRLIALDSPRALTRDEGTGMVRLVAPPGLLTLLAGLAGLREAREGEPGRYTLQTDQTNDVPALLADLTARLRDAGVTLGEVRVGHGSLEETFLRLIEHTGQEDNP